MSACDCGSWDGAHQGDCSLFHAAPESQPLTEEERDALAKVIMDHRFWYQDIGPIHFLCWCGAPHTQFCDEAGWAGHVADVIARHFAIRTAALLDRLKAAEALAIDRLNTIHEINEDTDERINGLLEEWDEDVSRRLASAEADKARAVAEALREHEAMRLARVDAHVAQIQAQALQEAADLIEPFSGIGLANGATRGEIARWLRDRAAGIEAEQ